MAYMTYMDEECVGYIVFHIFTSFCRFWTI